MVIRLLDGEMISIPGEGNEKDLQMLIREKLGDDCESLYREIVYDYTSEMKSFKYDAEEAKRDCEENIEFYSGMCHDAVDGIEECINMIDIAKRLDKQELRKRLKEIHDDIYRNL